MLGLLVPACARGSARSFTPDPAVQAAHRRRARRRRPRASRSSGFVFVVDGVLIGAGDGRWLARAMLATLVAYLPVILAVHAAGDWLLEGGSTRGQVDSVIWLRVASPSPRLHVGARHR